MASVLLFINHFLLSFYFSYFFLHCRFIHPEDLMRFMREDEAIKTISLFEGALDTGRISKSALKNWVVRI
jgi:hypothetical protein